MDNIYISCNFLIGENFVGEESVTEKESMKEKVRRRFQKASIGKHDFAKQGWRGDCYKF